MAKLDEPATPDVDEDALFAPGSWDVGPPSVRRTSVTPGRRSKRPPVEAPSPEPEPVALALVPVLTLVKAPEVEFTREPLSAADLASAYESEPDSVSGARLVQPSRRSPSVTASCLPVTPASKPAPQRHKALERRLPLASLLLSSVGIGFLLFGGRPAEQPATSTPRPPSEERANASAERLELVPAAAVVAPLPATIAQAARAPAPAAPSAAAVAARIITVELAVNPPDAAVGHLGIMQKGGPPYRFEIPEGKKIAVEVARLGYGTRKVTIDGSTPKLSIALRKTGNGG